jgi:hypothetical protein
MGFLERLNRILVSALLVLVFVQVGLLFFLQSLKDEAQFRLVKNTSKAPLVCGENQFADDNYWSIVNDTLVSQSHCTQGHCENSRLDWNLPSQNKELHLISINLPPPFRWEPLDQGGVVKVRVMKSEKPQIIALVSRAPLEWNFEVEKGARIEKIIVATPTTVWLQGVDAKIPIEYLPKEKMCSYPHAWEEAYNPENEFRVLVGALQKITQLSLNSFQGAEVGREFWIPRSAGERQAKPQVRGLASVAGERSVASERTVASVETPPVKPQPLAPASLTWQREQGHVIAEKFTLHSGEVVNLPAKTTQALEAEGVLYAVIKGKLNAWDGEKKTFVSLPSPLTLPELRHITAVAFDSEKSNLIVYNDERSGEFYSYEPKEKKWRLFKDGFKYNLASLFFDKETHQLTALISRGSFFTGLAFLKTDGKWSYKDLKEKLPYDRQRWRWSLDKAQGEWQVKLYSPVLLTGEARSLR